MKIENKILIKDYLNYSQGLLDAGCLSQSSYHIAPLRDNICMYLSSVYYLYMYI